MRTLTVILLLISNLLCSVQNSTAQENAFITTQYTVSDGLPHDRVSALTFDKKGFLWLATENGLYRFDSYNFEEQAKATAYTKDINCPIMETLHEDSKGNIWAGYSVGGMVKYDPIKQSSTFYSPIDKDSTTICGGSIRSICEDKDGNIWVGSSSSGIAKLNPKTGEFKHYLRKQHNNGCWTGSETGQVICTRDSNIWAASIQGLWKYNKQDDYFDRVDITARKRSGFFCSVAEDTLRNCLWLGQWGGAIAKVDLQTGKGKWVSAPFNNHYCIRPGKKGKIWIGSWGRGLYQFDPDTETFERHIYDSTSPLSKEVKVIRYIEEDASGDIWVGTFGSGLLNITPKKAFQKHLLPLNNNSIADTHDLTYFDNKLFITSSKGLFYQTDSGTFEKVKSKRKHLSRIFRIDSSQAWVTNTAQMECLQKNDDTYELKRLKLFKQARSEDTRKVTGAVGKDSIFYLSSSHYPMTKYKLGADGNYWREERFIPKNGAEGHMPTSKVRCLFKDSKEKIWIGSAGGLFQIGHKDKIIAAKHYITDNKRLNSDLIIDIKEDQKKRLLISTARGLNVLTPVDEKMYSLTVYDISNGLPENNIRACQPDKNGIIWLSTNTNVVRIDLDKNEVNAFGPKDGVNLPRFSQASAITPEGHIIFGGSGCIIEFDPTEISVSEKNPKLEISGFSILNTPIEAGVKFHDRVILDKAINYTDEIEITHQEKEFSVVLSLLEYQKNKKNFYEYKLSGFDTDWVQLGKQRTISFTNLPAGKYKLFARAITSNGHRINLPRPLTINVIPPWWQTIWFRISIILFIMAVSVSFYLYRINSIKAKNWKLEQLVEVRTNEIKQQAEELSSQRDQVQKQKQEIEKGLKNLGLLSEFGQKLTSTLSLTEILHMVHNYVSSIVQTDAFSVGFYRDRRKRIDYHAFYENGQPLELFSKAYAPNKSFSSWAIKNQKEVFENSVAKNYSKYFNETPCLNTSFDARSILVFPLLSGKKVIGVLSVYSRKENAYLQKDFSFVKSLSSYISIAVANARLYGEMNRKNENIQSSIAYARNIQETILPTKQQMDTFVKTFTMFMPKAVVSGDFYWYSDISTENKKEAIFAVVDCTGHGVPGAFMSLIGNRLLNRIINENKIHDPASILQELDRLIIETLNQKTSENNDGMDVALCKITQKKQGATISYAGAKRNLISISPSGKIHITKGSRKSIGGIKAKKNDRCFVSETFNVKSDTVLYLSSDGYVDQNGASLKKFGSLMLLEYLSEIYNKDMEQQAQLLKKKLLEHMDGFEQRDDITIMGIKIDNTKHTQSSFISSKTLDRAVR